MRIASFNILDGGIGRADPLAEVLLAQRADVVVLVEADDADVRERIAWRLGMDHAAAVGRNGRTAAILSRGRIRETLHLGGDAPQPRSLLLALVETPLGEVGVAAVHLSGRASVEREQQRLAEVEQVIAATAAWRDEGLPHVLAGDFNASSPVQQIDAAALPPKVVPHYESNGRTLPRDVVRRLLDAGYVDTLEAVSPTAAATATTFTTQHPGLLDYVFAHGLAVRDAWVERDRLAHAASDHLPVGAELARP